LKFGMFIYEPTPVEGFDLQVYRLKSERGIVGTPNPEMTTNIACFGDNNIASKHPDWVQMSKDGPALRTNKKYNFRWDIVCNHEKQMVDRMLDMIEDTAEKTKGITLSSMHYADHGFCTCPRCKEAYEKSGLDWLEWRAQTVTDFIKSAKERVKNKPFYVGLLPDPVNAYERFGFDFDALAEYADAFIVPHWSRSYATPWYFETMARAFKKVLKKPVYPGLYIRGPGDDPNEVEKPAQIIKTACRIARTGVDGLIFLAGNATIMKDFQKAAVANVKLREELEGYGGKPVLDLIDRWESIIQ
jgi:hypothetical protein